MWHNYFDAICMISVPDEKGKERLEFATQQMQRFQIPFSTIDAISGVVAEYNGAKGLFRTMKKVFEFCIWTKNETTLIVEDDIIWKKDPRYYLPKILEQLKEFPGWHMVNLGPNTHVPLSRVSENLLLSEQCRATHAMIYSKKGMIEALKHLKEFTTDIDVVFESKMQPEGHCYSAYPFLATQRNGYSHIAGAEVNMDYIEQRYERNTAHLL
jgi:hypothetical protein